MWSCGPQGPLPHSIYILSLFNVVLVVKMYTNYFFQAVYSHYIVQPDVVDITVEDPSQDFQRIRDYVDAKNCSDLPAYHPEKLLQG